MYKSSRVKKVIMVLLTVMTVLTSINWPTNIIEAKAEEDIKIGLTYSDVKTTSDITRDFSTQFSSVYNNLKPEDINPIGVIKAIYDRAGANSDKAISNLNILNDFSRYIGGYYCYNFSDFVSPELCAGFVMYGISENTGKIMTVGFACHLQKNKEVISEVAYRYNDNINSISVYAGDGTSIDTADYYNKDGFVTKSTNYNGKVEWVTDSLMIKRGSGIDIFEGLYSEDSLTNYSVSPINENYFADETGARLFTLNYTNEGNTLIVNISPIGTRYLENDFGDSKNVIQKGGDSTDYIPESGSNTIHDYMKPLIGLYNKKCDDSDYKNIVANNSSKKNIPELFNNILNLPKTFAPDIQADVGIDGSRVLDENIFDDFHAITFTLALNLQSIDSQEKITEVEYSSSNTSNSKRIIVKLTPTSDGKNYNINLEDYDLTELQRDMLRTEYTYIVKARHIAEKDGLILNLLLKDEVSRGEAEYEAEGTMSNTPVIDDEVRKVVEEYENMNFTRTGQGVIEVARLANTLSLYSIYLATHMDESALDESAINNTELNGMLDVWSQFGYKQSDDSNLEEDEIPSSFMYLPKEIDFLSGGYGNLVKGGVSISNGTTEETGDVNFQRIIEIFYAVSYAFQSLVDSEFGCSSGYGYQLLDKYLNDPSSVSEEDKSYAGAQDVYNWLVSVHGATQYEMEKVRSQEITSSTCIWVFRAIIELHDMCENLGIDAKSWSPAIYGYWKLYEDHPDFFNALRDNTSLYGLGYTGGATVENPIGQFFSITEGQMSDLWNTGYALSALYTPMVTNLYDASTYNFIEDPDWISEFFYKYGFNRKALYISTDPNIVTNSKLGKTSDNGRVVATLADLVNYDRDIQLYLDTNFYNAEQIEGAIGKVDYATLYQYMHQEPTTVNITDSADVEQLESQANGSLNQIYTQDSSNFVDETLNLDTDTLLKNHGVLNYSIDVAKNVTKFGETADKKESLYDGYVLSADMIIGEDSVFNYYQYSPMIAYGVVSAIYRDASIYNELSALSTSTTVIFESSRNVLFVNNASEKDWVDYMNYLMLANLETQMNKNVETQLDLNSPIFVDIFGNIVTESGYVIIPAACNATLTGYRNWNPYTVGFGTYYYAGGYSEDISSFPEPVKIWLAGSSYNSALASDSSEESGDDQQDPLTQEDSSVNLDNMKNKSGGWFIFARDGAMQLKNVELTSHGLVATINWQVLNSNSDVIQQVFWNDAYFTKAIKIYSARVVNMVVETLRGAPIENIDYNKEGIVTVESSDAGIVIAYALDKLLTTISSKSSDFVNSIVTMPNLAFMPYLKYVIYFAVKITLAIMIVLFLIRLFMDGVKNRFGFKHVCGLAFTIIVVVSAIYILPNSVIWTYDKANATVLSTEAADMLLYQTLREAEGQEIGITNVQQIDEVTELYMEIGKVTPSWSNILGKALLGNDYNSFTDLFDDAMKDSPYYGMKGVTQKGTNVYIPANYIINSTQITYSKTLNTLHNKLVVDPESRENGGFYGIYSYTSPYYVILDQLVANVNEFNNTHDVSCYTVGVDSKGAVLTYDIAAPYLLSDEFQEEGYDILGLTDILGCEVMAPKYTFLFDEEDKEQFQLSAWYPSEIDEDTKQARIKEVNSYARAFVTEHKEVLKHIPDAMFLKVLAFAVSVKYNQVFHIPYSDSIKLITVDNRDIMRFMLGSFQDVYSNYAYTFGRYVYNTTGTVGVILAAVLAALILLTTVLKPVLIAILFVLIIVNIAFRNLLFDKPNKGVEGYFIGCALFMILNFAYAGGLKICFMISNSNLSAIASMVICIVVQILYLLGMLVLIWTQISDWPNLGYNRYQNAGATLFGGIHLGFNRAGRNSRRQRRNARREADGRSSLNYYDESIDVVHHPSQEPQRVVIDENYRGPRNRQRYGARTIEDMRERDAERESSIYNRR